MLARHYAPRIPLECVEGSGRDRVQALAAEGRRVGWLTLGPPDGDISSLITVISLPPEPAGYAAGLYAALHALDALGLDRIIASLPPDTAPWLAVRDRLRRASA
jgi:L-threonylcarbamoyladenylate synthase